MEGAGERAASSAVGIVLLVAVAVIIAATVSVFALDFAEETDDVPPKGSFEFEYQPEGDTKSFLSSDPNRGSDNLTLVYTHGDTISADQINVTVRGAKEVNQFGTVVGTDLDFEPDFAGGGVLFAGEEEVSSGDSDTISDVDFRSKDGSGNLGNLRKLDLSEATVTVYWLDETGENGAVIAEWHGPDVEDPD